MSEAKSEKVKARWKSLTQPTAEVFSPITNPPAARPSESINIMTEFAADSNDNLCFSADNSAKKSKSFFRDLSNMDGRKKKLLSSTGEGAVALAAWGGLPIPLHGVVAAEGVQNPRPGHPEDWECSCNAYWRKQARLKGLEFTPCTRKGKIPNERNWEKMTIDNADAARALWLTAKHRNANVGMIMGERSGLVALDVDGELGKQSLAALESLYGPLPKTVTTITGSGGRHYLFRIPAGVKIKNSAKALGAKALGIEVTNLDIRGDGGQVVCPTSRHPNGNLYQWADGCSPDDIPFNQIPEMPGWLVQGCEDAKASNGKAASTAQKATGGQVSSPAADTFAKAGTALAGGSGGGYERFLAQIGDGDGLPGFNAPIWQSMLSFFSTHGPDADAEPMLERLREEIATAPRKPDRGTATKYDDDAYLAEQVEKARDQIRSNPSKGLPENVFRTAAEGVAAMNKVLAAVYPGGKTRFATYDRGALKLMSRYDAEARFANWRYIDPEDKQGKRLLPLFKAWLSSSDRREYADIGFEPGLDDPGFLNLWQGFAIEPNSGGSWKLMRRHLLEVVCGGDVGYFVRLIAWLAQMVQAPRKKTGTAVVIVGKKGVGKSILTEYVGRFLGAHMVKVASERHLTGNFNSHLGQALLIVAEEAIWGGNKKLDGILKDMITSPTMVLERKGIDAIEVANHARLILLSNEKRVVPASSDERRYFMLEANDIYRGDEDYFNALAAEMEGDGPAAMLHDLLNFDFGVVNLRQPPMTRALKAQIFENLDYQERWLFDLLADGAFVDEWGGAIEASFDWQDKEIAVAKKDVFACYDRYVTAYGRGNRHATPNEIGSFLKKALPGVQDHRAAGPGRTWHYVFPALPDLRAAFATKYNVEFEDGVALAPGLPKSVADRFRDFGEAMILDSSAASLGHVPPVLAWEHPWTPMTREHLERVCPESSLLRPGVKLIGA